MGKLNVSKFIHSAQMAVKKRSPEILTAIGIVGMVGTTVMAVKATPKALRCIEVKKEELDCEKLTPVDTVKATWKCYIPAGVTGVTSVACLIGASSVNARRNAALATAYSISKTALTEYQDKVVDTIGEKKERAIRDSIAKDKIERDPVRNHEVIITEKGTTLCYDGVFGRYFKSDIDTLKRAMNEMNRKMVSGDMYVSLNEFYSEIDLTPVDIGDQLGWNIDDGTIELDFSSQLAEDGTPCLVISYNVAPRYGYSNYM